MSAPSLRHEDWITTADYRGVQLQKAKALPVRDGFEESPDLYRVLDYEDFMLDSHLAYLGMSQREAERIYLACCSDCYAHAIEEGRL